MSVIVAMTTSHQDTTHHVEPQLLSGHDWPEINVKPDDPQRPCGFSNLAIEVQQRICAFAEPRTVYWIDPVVSGLGRSSEGWPALLHVCRRIRAEAAYKYYSQQRIQFQVRPFDFEYIVDWLHVRACPLPLPEP